LLQEQKLLLGRTDGRYVAPLTDKGIGPDPFEVVMQPFNELFGAYLRDELKVDWPEKYVQDSPVKDLDGWDWGDKTPFSRFAYGDRLNKVMASNPRFQVLVGNGYFDTQTTIGAAQLAVRQSGWPASTPWNGSPRTTRVSGRPSSTSSAPIYRCLTPHPERPRSSLPPTPANPPTTPPPKASTASLRVKRSSLRRSSVASSVRRFLNRSPSPIMWTLGKNPASAKLFEQSSP